MLEIFCPFYSNRNDYTNSQLENKEATRIMESLETKNEFHMRMWNHIEKITSLTKGNLYKGI